MQHCVKEDKHIWREVGWHVRLEFLKLHVNLLFVLKLWKNVKKIPFLKYALSVEIDSVELKRWNRCFPSSYQHLRVFREILNIEFHRLPSRRNARNFQKEFFFPKYFPLVFWIRRFATRSRTVGQICHACFSN